MYLKLILFVVLFPFLGLAISCTAGKASKKTAVEHSPDIPKFLEPKVFRTDKGTLPYRWINPLHTKVMPSTMRQYAQKPGGKYPLVIYLHGSGERGKNNSAQLQNGVHNFWAPAFYAQHPHFLLAPQCPKDDRWSFRDWEKEQLYRERPTIAMQTLIQLIEQVLQKNPAIDQNRIYLTGLSMGGLGTFDLLARRPEWFAAAVPICGGADPVLAPKMKNIAIWVFHGSADPVVNPVHSRRIVKALQEANAPMVGYTEYPGWNHNSWDATYGDRNMLEWMFRQKRQQ